MEPTNKFNIRDNVTAFGVVDKIYIVVGVLLEISVDRYKYLISPVNDTLIRIEAIEEVLEKVNYGTC